MAKKQVKEGRKKHFKIQSWKLYKVEGGKIVKRPETCPRCKKNLANAGNRIFCGGCGFTEFKK